MPSLFPQLFDFWFAIPFVLRIVLGIIFICHGFPKLFKNFAGTKAFFSSLGMHPAVAWVVAVGILEFFGGILLLIGLFVQPVALLLMVDMFFAIVLVARKKGFIGGWEFELVLFVFVLAKPYMHANSYTRYYFSLNK